MKVSLSDGGFNLLRGERCESSFVFSVNQIISLLNQIWNLDRETPQRQSALIGDQLFILFIGRLKKSSAPLILPGLLFPPFSS